MVGKKIKGRKRHIVVDVLGNLLAVVVHAANIHDTVSGIVAARKAVLAYPGSRGFCADAGYKGTFETDMWEIVERTLAWLNTFRRLSKDYEIKTFSAESFVKIAHLHTLLKRL